MEVPSDIPPQLTARHIAPVPQDNCSRLGLPEFVSTAYCLSCRLATRALGLITPFSLTPLLTHSFALHRTTA